jgi:hypothetical protein
LTFRSVGFQGHRVAPSTLACRRLRSSSSSQRIASSGAISPSQLPDGGDHVAFDESPVPAYKDVRKYASTRQIGDC